MTIQNGNAEKTDTMKAKRQIKPSDMKQKSTPIQPKTDDSYDRYRALLDDFSKEDFAGFSLALYEKFLEDKAGKSITWDQLLEATRSTMELFRHNAQLRRFQHAN